MYFFVSKYDMYFNQNNDKTLENTRIWKSKRIKFFFLTCQFNSLKVKGLVKFSISP